MEDIGKLAIDSDGEETEVAATRLKHLAGTPRTESPFAKPEKQVRHRRNPLFRSFSAIPWSSSEIDDVADIAVERIRDSPKPGRKLVKRSSQQKHKPLQTRPALRESGSHGCRWVCCLLLACSLTTTTLLCLFALGLFTFSDSREPTCAARQSTAIPLQELKTQLRKTLVGQSVAIDALTYSLELFSASASHRRMVLWFAGWEGSGKTLTINVMRTVLSQEFKIQSLLSSLFPQTSEGLEIRIKELLAALDPCAPNMVIIDGWNEGEDAQTPLTILDLILKGLHRTEAAGGGFYKVLVVLSGTTGAQDVWEHYRVDSSGVGYHSRGSESMANQERGFKSDVNERSGSERDLSQSGVSEEDPNQRIGPERNPSDTEEDLNLRRGSGEDRRQRIGPERDPDTRREREGDPNQRRTPEEDPTLKEKGIKENPNRQGETKEDRTLHKEDSNHRRGSERNPTQDDITALSLKLQETYQLTRITQNIALIPFLPMDATGLRFCIIRELLRLRREELVIDERALASIVKQVMLHTEWVPDGGSPIAWHGCKRVPSLVALFLPSPDA